MEHSQFSPSSSHIWSRCPGSLSLPIQETFLESEFALEGHKKHCEAHDFFSKNIFQCDDPHVSFYLSVLEKLKEEEGVSVLKLEEKIHVHGECFGTADAFAFNAHTHVLTVIDFKYGIYPVEVDENTQLLLYAYGLLKKYNAHYIVLKIVQPRAHHPEGPTRSVVYTRDQLLEFVHPLKKIIDEPKEEFKTGGHCKFCKRKFFCKAFHDAAVSLTEVALKSPKPQKIEKNHVGKFYEQIKIALEKLTALEKIYAQHIKHSLGVPGYNVVPALSTRKWVATPRELKSWALANNFEICEEVFLSPAQIEKKYNTQVPKNFVNREIIGVRIKKGEESV
jgi:hypothetical protein